ncbi:MAG: lytic murein transglycosylase [Patescibacteria group bacterium]
MAITPQGTSASITRIAAIAVMLVFFTIVPVDAATNADITAEIADKNRQIQELQKQIDNYQQQIDANRSKSVTLSGEISKLNAKINQVTLEVRSLGVSIDQTGLEIQDTQTKIGDALESIERHRLALGQYLRLAYSNDHTTLTEILLNNSVLSDFFSDIHYVETTQANIQNTINDIKDEKQELDVHKEKLEDKKSDLQRLKQLQEVARRGLSSDKMQKDKLLKDTKGQETKYQELVKKSKVDLERIRDQVYYLQQNGVSVEDAVKYAQLAAIRAGIRPAFLLGILEIESGLGKNVGKGNWMNDMYQCYLRLGKPQRAEVEKAAFLKIVAKLNLNADTVKVSREPNYGCGGAMGPAQFIPSTWLAYEEEVARLTGHNPPNPWSVEDAFMASATKLARGGATSKTREGEVRAAKAYISGKPTCSTATCNYYANAVLRKAADIEPNL